MKYQKDSTPQFLSASAKFTAVWAFSIIFPVNFLHSCLFLCAFLKIADFRYSKSQIYLESSAVFCRDISGDTVLERYRQYRRLLERHERIRWFLLDNGVIGVNTGDLGKNKGGNSKKRFNPRDYNLLMKV